MTPMPAGRAKAFGQPSPTSRPPTSKAAKARPAKLSISRSGQIRSRASVVVSKFATFRYRSPSELRNQNDTRNQYVASVLSIPKFAERRYRDIANFGNRDTSPFRWRTTDFDAKLGGVRAGIFVRERE